MFLTEKKQVCRVEKGSTFFLVRQGFTLIELMIVLGVIAIVASILVPNIKGMRQEGDILKAKSEVKTLQTAIESYYLKRNRYYPEKLEDLLEVTPRLIDTIPTDPFSHKPYQYEVISSEYYIVWSNGPNKAKDFRTTTKDGELVIEKNSVGDDILASSLLLK